MGKNKLKKFGEMETFPNVFQYPFAELQKGPFPLKGKWNTEFFKNDNPIVLELGCGKGEYAVGMAKKFADRNFIGVDIKGARMWTGAKQSVQEGIANVAFLRTSIELIASFFEAGEVSEIWITFPDPQMQKVNKRLTSTRFMQLYRQILKDGGLVHLKTDSPFLYAYTDAMVRLNGFATEVNTDDLYHSGLADDILEIRTFYERQWLARGLTIKYINWHLDATTALQECRAAATAMLRWSNMPDSTRLCRKPMSTLSVPRSITCLWARIQQSPLSRLRRALCSRCPRRWTDRWSTPLSGRCSRTVPTERLRWRLFSRLFTMAAKPFVRWMPTLRRLA